MERPVLFISYAHMDKHILVVPLAETLKDGGYEVWFDHELVPGRDWREQLLEEIERSSAFVYAMTPESVTSEYCLWELKEATKLQKPIIPVKLQTNTNIPDLLKSIQHVDFTQGPTNQAIAKLLHGLRVATTLSVEKVADLPSDPKGTPAQVTIQEKIEKGEPVDTEEFGFQIEKYLDQSDFPKLTVSIINVGILRLQRRILKDQQVLLATLEITHDYYSRITLIAISSLFPESRFVETALRDIGWNGGAVSPDNTVTAKLDSYYRVWNLPLERGPISLARILIESMRIVSKTEAIYKSNIRITPQL